MATNFTPSSKGCVPPRDCASALESFIRESTQAQAKLLRGAGLPFKSERPYQYDMESAGLTLLCDYEWDYEPDHEATVIVTRIVLQGHDGSEYPLKRGAIRSSTIGEIESLIADEINDANDAAAESLRDGE